MNGGQKAVRRLASGTRPSLQKTNICTTCLLNIYRRQHAATAAAPTESIPFSTQQPAPPVVAATAPHQVYQISASVVLSRPPQLTRDLTPFEKAYFLYQRRLNERLALPFQRYFYYPKGTASEVEWKRKIKERLTPARDIGVYAAYSKEGWNDEVLVGAPESEPQHQIEAMLKDAEVKESELEKAGEQGEEVQATQKKKDVVEKPMPRVTEADIAGDTKSLNRALTRTLHLVVKGDTGGWRLPSSGLVGKESLHTAAERILVQAGGVNMNTWVIGNVPIGHHNLNHPQTIFDKAKGVEELGTKTFFMRARIMAGQANLKNNKLGLTDFMWLASDEIKREVSPTYWNGVRNMLPER